MTRHSEPAEIVRFQQKQEAKFLCSACGADRGCNCNAPAVEKLAELVEQRRAARRTYDEKKRQQNQQSSDIRSGADWPEPVAGNEKPPEPEPGPILVEHRIVHKLAQDIVDIGYKALSERFADDKPTITRLNKARKELRNGLPIAF